MRSTKPLFYGLGLVLLISLLVSSCGPQPAAQAPVEPSAVKVEAPTSTPTPGISGVVPEAKATSEPKEAGAMPEEPSFSEAELVQRVLDALSMLDGSPIEFKLEQVSLQEQQVFENGEWSNMNWHEVIKDSGVRIQDGNALQVRQNRSVDFPGVAGMFPMQAEIRLVDGETYVQAAYTEADPKLPVIQEMYLFAVPQGWLKVNNEASLVYWPALGALSLEDALKSLNGDASMLLTGHSRHQIEATIKTNLDRAAYEPDTDEQGGPIQVITFFLKPAALVESLNASDANDPVIPLLVDTAEGTPVIYRMVLDKAGRLQALDRVVRVEASDLDLSSIPGVEPGTKLSLRASQRLSAQILSGGKVQEAIAAPETTERVKDSAFSGSGGEEPPFRSLDEFNQQLASALEQGEEDNFWQEIVDLGQMPLIFEDWAVFLYRGEADRVDWVGDWSTPNGTRLGGTDLWLHAATLPRNARLEYQLLLNGEKYITDPLNPLTETGGLGTKSVVLMPEYVPPQFTEAQAGVPQGTLTENIPFSSASLGYDVNCRVYTPAGYERMVRLPVIYVVDGQDYLQFGRMATVLDNLIATKEIRPLVAVFIDPRDTETGENLRDKQFFDNPQYGDFIARELIPAIDKMYRTDRSPQARAILGASNGGYHSAYFARRHSDLIGLIGMMSPNLDHNPELLNEYEQSDRLPLNFFLSTGRWHDFLDSSREMRDTLEAKGYPLLYLETDEGHSYGNWRDILDDLLVYFFGS